MNKGKKTGITLMLAGAAALTVSLCLLVYNTFEENSFNSESAAIVSKIDLLRSSKNDSGVYSDDMPSVEIDGLSYIGTLSVDSLGFKLPVISEWDFYNARKALCRYTGSVKDNSMIIAGHNYPSNFGKLSELQKGDKIIFEDMKGSQYTYYVIEIKTLKSTDVEGMQAGDWDLTLFTCTWDAQSRVTVRCRLENSKS